MSNDIPIDDTNMFDLIIRDGPMGVSIVEIDGSIIWCNHVFSDFVEYEPVELLDKTFMEITHPEDIDIDVGFYDKLMNGEISSYSIDKRYITKSGKYVWGRLFASLIEENGKQYAVGMIYDVNKDKREQIKLEDESAQYRQAVDYGKVGLWIWDPVSDDLYWNDIMLELYGTNRNDFAGRGSLDFFDAVCEADRARIADSVQRTMETGIPYREEFSIQRRNDKRKIFIYGAAGLYTNEVTGKKLMVGTNLDISPLMMAKEEVEISQKELEAFAYAISHDLKAPLRAVDNLSQWIAEDLGDNLTDGVNDKVIMLRERVERMKKLIDGLLDYSRIGRIDNDIEVFCSKKFIEDITTSLYENDEVDFVINNLPEIKANQIRFYQVMSNIIDNGVKHNKSAKPCIEIGYNDLGDFVEFYVKDNGIGIEEKYHSKIFDMFTKLSPKDDGDGVGAGLALIQRIVTQMGGTIRLESEAEQGTVFYFSWPKESKQEKPS